MAEGSSQIIGQPGLEPTAGLPQIRSQITPGHTRLDPTTLSHTTTTTSSPTTGNVHIKHTVTATHTPSLSGPKKEDNTFEVIIIFILIIVLLIVLTTTMYYLRRRAECFTYPSPWCYSDWICEDLPADEQNRWDMLKSQNLASVDATDGACFLSDGTINPTCFNAWKSFVGSGLSTGCGTDGNSPCNCTGPGGQSGPCTTAYNTLPVQGAS